MKDSIPQLRKELADALARIDYLQSELDTAKASRGVVKVQVPVDRVVYVDKRVDVPVEKIVKRKVIVDRPVTVERIVTREVEKPVTVVKRIEVPVERIVYVDNPALVDMVRKLQSRLSELTSAD